MGLPPSVGPVHVRRPAALTATTARWRALSTRSRLRILVVGLGVLGLVFRDLLILGAAALTLLLAETMPAAKPLARPN